MAQRIPSNIISLNDKGVLGVKYLEQGTVRFAAITSIDETPEGIWVTGLPDRVQIIVQGQDYVAAGVKAEARSPE